MRPSDVIIMSTADWDNPFWTNKQHVAVQMAALGHRVIYIDSLGLRRPSASSSDLKRILVRLKRAVKPPRLVRHNIWVWSPVVLPLHNVKPVRFLNRMLLGLGLSFWMRVRGFRHRDSIFWTYSPITTSIFRLSKFRMAVYHCVDEVKAQPGMPVATIEKDESDLMRAADAIFVTSRSLELTRRECNKNTFYFSNVADYEHFSSAKSESLAVPADLLAIPGPRIGFVGAISGYKVDFPLLASVAKARPNWSFVLIGKVGEGDPWTDVASLKSYPNIHFLGSKAYADLPAYLKGIDAAILPCALNEYTKGMFPMKFFEYLAAGKYVVSTPLDSLAEFGGIARFASDSESFVGQLELVLTGDPQLLDRSEILAKENTYESRMKKMMRCLENLRVEERGGNE